MSPFTTVKHSLVVLIVAITFSLVLTAPPNKKLTSEETLTNVNQSTNNSHSTSIRNSRALDQSDSPQSRSTTEEPRETNETTTETQPSANEEATELPNFTSSQDTSTFTCNGRVTGYYADVKLGCRVYHFCTAIEGIEKTAYQRMSYICLEGSFFDQKDLNCVKKQDLKVQCEDAEKEYESSNKQFDPKDESQPSMSDSLTANIMMNPIARFIAGR